MAAAAHAAYSARTVSGGSSVRSGHRHCALVPRAIMIALSSLSTLRRAPALRRHRPPQLDRGRPRFPCARAGAGQWVRDRIVRGVAVITVVARPRVRALLEAPLCHTARSADPDHPPGSAHRAPL